MPLSSNSADRRIPEAFGTSLGQTGTSQDGNWIQTMPGKGWNTILRSLWRPRDRKKADSSLGACSNLSAFTWANCERPSGGARQGKGGGEKHGKTYALRQRLFNDRLGERPICA